MKDHLKFDEERTDLSIDGVGKTGYLWKKKKIEVDAHLTPYTQINLRSTKYSNTKKVNP